MNGAPESVNLFEQALWQQADTVNALLREYGRAKIQKLDILNYNGANLAYNHAADTANKLGLSEQQKLGVTPFPSATNISISGATPKESTAPTSNPEPAKTDSAVKSWVPATLGALGGAGGLAAAMLAAQYMLPDHNEEPASPPAVTSPNDLNQNQPPILDKNYDPSVGLEVEGVPGGW